MAAPSTDIWVPRGPAIRDAPLRERLGAMSARARAVLELDADEAPDPEPRDTTAAVELLDRFARLAAGRVDAADLRVEIAEIRGEVREYAARVRWPSVAGIQKALSRLRSVVSPEELLARAPMECARGLGFDRVFISQVENSMWVPVKVHVDGDEEWAEEILAAGRDAPTPLDHLVLETEMARRRVPMLVRDVKGTPNVHEPIAQASDSRSYVAAPIMPEGQVIGFFHADCHLTRRQVDELDRDLLFAFAEGFGYLYERLVLAERLRAQGEHVRAMAASLETVIEEVREAEVRIGRTDDVTAPPVVQRAPAPSPDGRLSALLTARELDVTRLMAAGATNAEIAARLVISEGTVKSHVKHILRKMRASNRAEAASKYMRLSTLAPHEDR